MPRKDRVTEGMKAAMRAKDRPRLSAVRLLLAAMKQKEAPVELAYQVLVGTSRNGERRPPVTLPKASSTGWPFCTTIGSLCGGATPAS